MIFTYKNVSLDIIGYDENDFIYTEIKRTNTFYELELLEYINVFHSDKENIMIDVGANIGNHSIFFSKFLSNHVVSVEPNPEVLPILKKNLIKNKINGEILEFALGEKKSKAGINMPENSNQNIGMAKISENDGDIDIITLDSVTSNLDILTSKTITNVSLIKIDVEGMELAVLKGGEKTINKYKPSLFIEAATESHLFNLTEYLDTLGYKPLTNLAGTPVYHFAHSPSLNTILLAKLAKVFFKIKHRVILKRFKHN